MARNEHDLLESVIEARKRCNELSEQLDNANRLKNAAEKELITYLEDNDLSSFESTMLNASVDMKKELTVRIIPDKKEQAFLFIEEECGRGDMIKVKKEVHWKTLTSFIGDMIRKGVKYPEDCFGTWQKPKLDVVQNGQKIKSKASDDE